MIPTIQPVCVSKASSPSTLEVILNVTFLNTAAFAFMLVVHLTTCETARIDVVTAVIVRLSKLVLEAESTAAKVG
jgi:hypothetical protein